MNSHSSHRAHAHGRRPFERSRAHFFRRRSAAAMTPRAVEERGWRSVCSIIAINQTTYRSAVRRAAVRRASATGNAGRSSPPRGARFKTRSQWCHPSSSDRNSSCARGAAIIARDIRSPSFCSRIVRFQLMTSSASSPSAHARAGSINAMRNVAVSTQVLSTGSIGFAVFHPVRIQLRNSA